MRSAQNREKVTWFGSKSRMRESRETGGGRTPPTTQIPDLDSHLRTIILGLEGGGGLENGEKVPWSLPHKTKAALVAKAQAQLDAGPLPLASSLKKTNVSVSYRTDKGLILLLWNE